MKLLDEASHFKFVTRKRNIVNDQSNANETIYNTEALKSNVCDFNDAYILVKHSVKIAGIIVARVAFKNCAPLIK